MSDATIHAIPSETTLVEDMSTLWADVKRYFHRNGDAFLAIGLTTAAIAVNRAIVRREIKRLTFNIEIFPDDSWGDYGTSRFDEE